MNRYLEKEETILEPHLTHFRTEGWLWETKHLANANSYCEFGITWAPLTYWDYQNLHEHLQNCLTQVERMKQPHSNKEPRPLYETKKGMFYSSQLFVPKLNLDYNHPDELVKQQATITGHARDLPCGAVVINVDYIDVCDPSNGIDASASADDDDDEDDGW